VVVLPGDPQAGIGLGGKEMVPLAKTLDVAVSRGVHLAALGRRRGIFTVAGIGSEKRFVMGPGAFGQNAGVAIKSVAVPTGQCRAQRDDAVPFFRWGGILGGGERCGGKHRERGHGCEAGRKALGTTTTDLVFHVMVSF